MKILIVAVHFEVTGARYIADAFTRLGHDVKHIGPRARLKDAWGVDVDAKYEWKPDEMVLNHYIPDLIIIADTLMIGWENPSPWNGKPVVTWVQDNHVRNVRRPHVDHYFLAHFHGPAQPVTQPDETWLPCAADSKLFTPSPIQWEKREYDACLVGVMYPRRVEVVQALRDVGLKVFTATGLVYEEYRNAYWNSRISLCVSAAGDVAQRIFETGRMGCAVMTDPLRDLNDRDCARALGLSGYTVYTNPKEAANIALDLLNTSEKYLHIGQNAVDLSVPPGKHGAMAMAQACQHHIWEKRAQVVVDWYEKTYGAKMSEPVEIKPTVVLTQPRNLDAARQLIETQIDPKPYMPPIDMHPQNGRTDVLADLNGGIIIENEPRGAFTMQLPQVEGKPYLNLGCGKTHLPSAPPPGHETVDPALYGYPLWLNVDKVEGVGADETFDLFQYPWPLEDNSFDGALLAHICEHIPHEIFASTHDRGKPNAEFANASGEKRQWYVKRAQYLADLQDGWSAFFSELYRVLTPNSRVHVVSPYGHSDSGIVDFTHTRYLTPASFTHSMTPDSDGATFQYNNGGINFVMEGQPFARPTPMAKLAMDRTGLDFNEVAQLFNNVVYDFYITLRTVK